MTATHITSPLRPCAAAALSLAVLVAIASCGEKTALADHDRSEDHAQILRRAVGGDPATLDPGMAVDSYSHEVLRDLYEGLTTESPEGEVRPGVADTWSTDATGKEYRFHLRENARWSDGSTVRAQDFVMAWRRVVDPKHGSPVADLLRPIAHAREIIAGRLPPAALGVRADEDHLLVVQLEQPAPYFPELLTHSVTFPIFSEDAAGAHTAKGWVSNGPYVLASWRPASSLNLASNPEYWDREHVRIANVDWIAVADENSELAQYRAAQIDITQTVPIAALPWIRKELPSELTVAPFLGTFYFAINLHSVRFSSNPKLRQALSMAIDRQTIKKVLLEFGQVPAYGFVPPGTSNYEPQAWEWKDLPDVERIAQARALYSASGYSAREPLHLRLLLSSNPALKRLSVAVASMWREVLGIETELVDEEYRVFLDSRKDSARWDVVRLGWMADYNDAGNFLDIFRSGAANNDAGYSDPRFDSLLDAAEASADSQHRRDLLEQAERLMLAEYPVIPIYFYSSKRLIKPYVKGARPNPLNRLYSADLYIELN